MSRDRQSEFTARSELSREGRLFSLYPILLISVLLPQQQVKGYTLQHQQGRNNKGIVDA